MSQTARILFVDDDKQLTEVLARQSRAAGFEPLTAHNALTALNVIERQAPDLICLDVNMPTANGLSIGEMISVNIQQVPIVVLTGMTDEATRTRCATLGARYVAKGNDTWPRLLAVLNDLLERPCDSADGHATDDVADGSEAITDMVFEMLGTKDTFLYPAQTNDAGNTGGDTLQSGPWVLCVEDDRDFSLALQLKLKRHNVSVVRAFEGVEGVNAALTRPAEAILLDYNLPNGRGDFVLRRLKASPVTRDIPVIVISGQKRTGLEKEMLHLGAARFFAKPVRFEELIEELQRHITVVV